MSNERGGEWAMRTYINDIAVGGDIGLLDEIAHPDVIDLGVVAAGGPAGIDGLRTHVRGAHASLDNRSAEIVRLLATDNEVMAWWTLSGDHIGSWIGADPSGRRVSATAFSFFRLRDGKVFEYQHWGRPVGNVLPVARARSTGRDWRPRRSGSSQELGPRPQHRVA